MAPGSLPSRSPRSISAAEGRRPSLRGSVPCSSWVPASEVRGAPRAGALHPGSGCRRHPRALPPEELPAALHQPSTSPWWDYPTKSWRAQTESLLDGTAATGGRNRSLLAEVCGRGKRAARGVQSVDPPRRPLAVGSDAWRETLLYLCCVDGDRLMQHQGFSLMIFPSLPSPGSKYQYSFDPSKP